MKKSLVVLFCVLFLTMGLSAGKKGDCARMKLENCARFDYDIKQAFKSCNVEMLNDRRPCSMIKNV